MSEEEYTHEIYPDEDELDQLDNDNDGSFRSAEEQDLEEQDLEDSFGGEENFTEIEDDELGPFGGNDPFDINDNDTRISEDENGHLILRSGRERGSRSFIHRQTSDEGPFSIRRRHSLIPSLRSGEFNSARVFVNADGGMRIRLSDNSSGGLMEFLDHLPAALNINTSISIVSSDGTTHHANRGDIRSRMHQFMSAVSPRRQENNVPALHPLLSVDEPAGVRRSSGRNPSQRRQGFSFSEQGFLDVRPRVSQRRNNLGPMMSDRRWGVDLSSTALTEGRLPILTSAVEDALKDVIESSKHEEEEEESKEEKELQEYKEGDEPDADERRDQFRHENDQNVTNSSTNNADVRNETINNNLPAAARVDANVSTEEAGADSEMSVLTTGETTTGVAAGTASDAMEETASLSFSVPTVERDAGDEPRDQIPDEDGNLQSRENAGGEFTGLLCPDGYDREVWASLPSDVQVEVLSTVNADEPAQSNVENTDLDREVLASLPSELRSEVLREEEHQRSMSVSGPESANENLLFISSLGPDLRRDVLLSADDTFLNTLPENIQVEARRLRRGVERRLPDGRRGAIEDEEWWQSLQANAEPPVIRSRESEEPKVVTDISISEDRIGPVPLDGCVVWRLLRHIVLGHRTRCSRPLLRLLACLCRYRVARLPILSALNGLLQRDFGLVEEGVNQFHFSSIANEDVGLIKTAVVDGDEDELLLRRLLGTVSYLHRKVLRLVWLDMIRPQDHWVFGGLIDLIGRLTRVPELEATIDIVLHVLDELCEPINKLTPTQANQLSSSLDAPPEGMARMPFPVLSDSHLPSLEKVITISSARNSSGKLLQRILKTLALQSDNWARLVSTLAMATHGLAEAAASEIARVCSQLEEVVHLDGDATTVLALPLFSSPSSSTEASLFQVLQYMKTMRSPLSDDEAEQVASYIRGIDFGSVWSLLATSLSLIRRIEGLGEDKEKGKSLTASLSSSTSTLIMRFLPLIQCFFTVCDSTLLRKPLIDTESKDSGGALLRKRSFEETDVDSAILRATNKLVKPGERFRRHDEYYRMQMDLIESPLTEQLLGFVDKNAVVINMLLSHNISLLDSSFKPLICVPRLRHQLHFDLKREYFRLKLKKLRHSAVRSHGPLRLNVRRDRVFEDSLAYFEKLRTGDEVRRKLSINFIGEEGMDAGGLTREWYTVLAREMFNPNYALFTATADGVTFQPNVKSSVHTHHLIYFKFVGRVIGKAISDGQLLDAHFTRSFYKHILGLPVNYHDLEAIEPDFYKSLKQMQELPLDLLGLDLTFSTEIDDFGRTVVKPLIENGQNIPVTDENKMLYIQLIAHSRMTTAIEKQVNYYSALDVPCTYIMRRSMRFSLDSTSLFRLN